MTPNADYERVINGPECPRCKGEGVDYNGQCSYCNGWGYLPSNPRSEP